MSTFFIYYKPNIIDGIRKFKNCPYWRALFLVVSFNEIPLFSKDLITFIISFISWFIRVIPEPVTNEIAFLIFLPIMLIPASTSLSLFSYPMPATFNSFANEFANDVIF